MDLLAHQIWQSLDLDLVAGAEFLAEQFVAGGDSVYARYLLATVQFRRGKYATAMATVKEVLTSLDCVWVYAKCCLKTGNAKEGIRALERVRAQWDVDNDLPFPSAHGRCELSAAGFHLLHAQLLAQASGEPDCEAALVAYAKSARLNPFLVENVLPLAESIKARVHASALFAPFADPFARPDVDEAAESEELPILHKSALTSTPRRFEASPNMLSTPLLPNVSFGGGEAAGMAVGLAPCASATTAGGAGATSGAPAAGSTSAVAGTTAAGTANSTATLAPPALSPPSVHRPVFQPAGAHGLLQTPMHIPPPSAAAPPTSRRRQERIFSLSFKRQDQSSLSSLGKNIFTSPPPPPSVFEKAGLGLPMSLVAPPGGIARAGPAGVSSFALVIDAVELFSRADFSAALAQLEKLSPDVQQTPFVLALRGRCHLELLEYQKGVESYRQLRSLQPDRVEDMEYYSTALWHLKDAQALAQLGYELTNRKSPLRRSWQSWCVLGNAFSLSHDTSNALKCFERACSLNPASAYVRTLMGYEHISNDEYQCAVDAFMHALKAEPQRYNAWYGLGSVYYSLGRYDEAQAHFHQALILNPNNSVLLCLVGAVYEALGEPEAAIEAFSRACELNREAPTPRFRKAEVLISVGRFREALHELEQAERVAPEDYNIQIALGKAYKGLGMSYDALRHLTNALQLAPKSASHIKREIEALS